LIGTGVSSVELIGFSKVVNELSVQKPRRVGGKQFAKTPVFLGSDD